MTLEGSASSLETGLVVLDRIINKTESLLGRLIPQPTEALNRLSGADTPVKNPFLASRFDGIARNGENKITKLENLIDAISNIL